MNSLGKGTYPHAEQFCFCRGSFKIPDILTIVEGGMSTKEGSAIHRRDFLGALMATGALGLSSLAPFQLNAMQAQGMEKANGSGMDEWLNKMRGKHRQVFDSPHNAICMDAGLPHDESDGGRA
jgi:hypothetical protein